jgi:hypothetical protein
MIPKRWTIGTIPFEACLFDKSLITLISAWKYSGRRTSKKSS